MNSYLSLFFLFILTFYTIEADQKQIIEQQAQPVASTIIIPNIPQRTERPPEPIITASVTPRPLLSPKSLPVTVTIEQRSAVYPYTILTPLKINRKGDEIKLDNGSNWKIRHRDHRTVKKWKSGEDILIETSQFFSWSAYKLVNYSRKESIDVELIDPVHQGMLAHCIAEIQPFEGYLRLQDGSIWRISTRELFKWEVGDDVIIAINKNWFSNDSSYVLINPRAKIRLMAILRISL